MEKSFISYILAFIFSFVTIFEGMYVLSKIYPELFRPLSKSDAIAVASVQKDSVSIAWEDTSSIGLEYVEAYKLDSLKKEFERVSDELRKYKDSVNALYRMVRKLEVENKEKDVYISRLQAQISKYQDEKIKSIAKIYETMEPSSAAKILENMPADQAITIILNMQRRQAGKILAEMNAQKATQLTKINGK